MNKQTLKNTSILPVVAVLASALTGCVSAGKYHDLEGQHENTQAQLASCENEKADLQRRLGITASQKTELEGSVETMRKAMAELEARRAETEKRLSEFRELTAKFKNLVDAGKLTIKVRNGRMMLALSSDILFTSGSAQLSKAGADEIKEVTKLLKELSNRNFQVEGHTDNMPIHTRQFPSNWELASARAASVLNTMLTEGFPPEHVSMASYGKYDPLNSNTTPEERAENRRIAIVVVPDLSTLPGIEELNKMSTPASGKAAKAAAQAAANTAPAAMPTSTPHAAPTGSVTPTPSPAASPSASPSSSKAST